MSSRRTELTSWTVGSGDGQHTDNSRIISLNTINFTELHHNLKSTVNSACFNCLLINGFECCERYVQILKIIASAHRE